MIDPFENPNVEIDADIFAILDSYAKIYGYDIWVWSSGLVKWEKGWMSYSDREMLTYFHTKIVKEVPVHIYRDVLGRYVALNDVA